MELTYNPPRPGMNKATSTEYSEGLLRRLADEAGCKLTVRLVYDVENAAGRSVAVSANSSMAFEFLNDAAAAANRDKIQTHYLDDTTAQTRI